VQRPWLALSQTLAVAAGSTIDRDDLPGNSRYETWKKSARFTDQHT
jgi:hypothetical protein